MIRWPKQDMRPGGHVEHLGVVIVASYTENVEFLKIPWLCSIDPILNILFI